MTNNIYALLNEDKTCEALDLLLAKIESLHIAELTEAYYTLRNNYNAYLRAKVTSDTAIDEREDNVFIQQAYTLNDRANRRIRILKSPNDLYSKNVESHLSSGEEQAETSLFTRIWTSDLWDDKEEKYINDIISLDAEKYPLITSAVTLALNEMFDIRKLMFLFDAYTSDDERVRARAIVGIIIVLRRYDSRIPKFPQITSRMSLMAEDDAFVRDIFNAHLVLQYSKLTDTISDKMRNDIMPAILQSSKFVQTEMGLKEIDEALTSKGENPDWIKNNKINKKAEKKIRQMAQLQTEGADIYMATFRQLKNFPFFKQMENWFKPFNANEPDIEQMSNNPLINKLLKLTPFCDSDKYSFVLMALGMGIQGQDVLSNQLGEQLPEGMSLNELIKEQENDINAKIDGEKSTDTMRKYTQDLYRFFNVFEYHHQFWNPFDAKISNFVPIARNAFRCLFEDHRNDEHLHNLADFFMRKELYADALEMFSFLTPQRVEKDADLWQKMGFCMQKMHRNTEALEFLTIADELNPDSHWNALHISQSAFEIRKFDVAIYFLNKLYEEEPENIKTILKIAECHFGLEEYDKATPLLYKVIYLDEDSLVGHQMLAWGLLMTQSYSKSEVEYKKCIELGDITSNIGLGHVQLALGNRQQAYENYRNAYKLYLATKTSPEEAKESFYADFWKFATYLTRISVNQNIIQTIYNATLMGI